MPEREPPSGEYKPDEITEQPKRADPDPALLKLAPVNDGVAERQEGVLRNRQGRPPPRESDDS